MTLLSVQALYHYYKYMNYKRFFIIYFCFLADLLLHGFFRQPVYYITRLLYYQQALIRAPVWSLIFMSFLVSSQSFLYYDYFGTDLFTLVPLGFIFYNMQSLINITKIVQLVVIFSSLIIHVAIIDWGIYDQPIGFWCLKNNLLHFIILLFVVYYYLRGSQGNRSWE